MTTDGCIDTCWSRVDWTSSSALGTSEIPHRPGSGVGCHSHFYGFPKLWNFDDRRGAAHNDCAKNFHFSDSSLSSLVEAVMGKLRCDLLAARDEGQFSGFQDFVQETGTSWDSFAVSRYCNCCKERFYKGCCCMRCKLY